MEAYANHGLTWWPELGMGHYPVSRENWPYDADYFAKYRGYADTDRGCAITRARVDLVGRYTDGPVVDIGIGCGHFIESRGGQTTGYDVNPAAIQWLKSRNLYHDIERHRADSATFWDSLEHIPEPDRVLAMVDRFAFVCMPIFRDLNHLMASKHYRQDEHYWYWTRKGLTRWMASRGFVRREHNTSECRLGREDIETFVFERQP